MTKRVSLINFDKKPTIPLFCEVCEFMMSNTADIEYYERYKCCEACGLKWAETSLEWKSGWRPLKIDIDNEIIKRKKRRER